MTDPIPDVDDLLSRFMRYTAPDGMAGAAKAEIERLRKENARLRAQRRNAAARIVRQRKALMASRNLVVALIAGTATSESGQ